MPPNRAPARAAAVLVLAAAGCSGAQHGPPGQPASLAAVARLDIASLRRAVTAVHWPKETNGISNGVGPGDGTPLAACATRGEQRQTAAVTVSSMSPLGPGIPAAVAAALRKGGYRLRPFTTGTEGEQVAHGDVPGGGRLLVVAGRDAVDLLVTTGCAPGGPYTGTGDIPLG